MHIILSIKNALICSTFIDSEEHSYDSKDKDNTKTTRSAEETASDGDPTSLGKIHRKRRILFTREQTYELQKVFQYQQYLTVPQRDYLSRKINLTPTQVKRNRAIFFFFLEKIDIPALLLLYLCVL